MRNNMDGTVYTYYFLKRAALVCILLLTMRLPTVSAQDKDVEQDGGSERDPFYQTQERPAPHVPTPLENDWSRDPFNNPLARKAPVQTGPPQTATHKGLTGIIYSKQVRLAIIDGEALREGSTVGDKKVIEIRRRSVILINAAGAAQELLLRDFTIGQ